MKPSMNKKLITLITGTSRGIGKFLVNYYLAKDHIVIGCSRNSSEITYPNYFHFELDVSDEIKVKQIFSFIRKEYGRLDILINNAGIASMNHSVLTPISTAKKILDTNIIGTFLFSREAFKIMKSKKFGRIINFATFAVPFKLEGEAIYAASKAAVITLTEILCREYANYNITVNAVAPPAVKTDLIKGVPNDKLNGLISRQAIHRYGEPSEVANVIDFLIDEKSELISGQIIYLGGI